MHVEQIREDLMYLAGRLLHRGAQTEDERHAAEFIRKRLSEYTSDVEMDPFHTIENYPYLFASYYSEFFVVGVLAIWWPWVALVYGSCAFLAYLAEFMGYRVFSRLPPQFESQNVIARFLAPRPKHLFVVTAHYDSGCASPLTHPDILPKLRILHLGVVACMVVVLCTCATDGLGQLENISYPLTAYLRWTAVGLLMCAAFAMFYASTQGEDIRGANVNASGVAALLRLGAQLEKDPLETADVWLVATGSHEAWMSGMRHFLTTQKLDKRSTHLLNVEGIGAGRLHHLRGEGVMHFMRSGKALVSAATATGHAYGAVSGVLRAIPSAAHVPLARGYNAMTIMGLDRRGLPLHWNAVSDRMAEVNEENIARGADLSEAVLRRLEQDLA